MFNLSGLYYGCNSMLSQNLDRRRRDANLHHTDGYEPDLVVQLQLTWALVAVLFGLPDSDLQGKFPDKRSTVIHSTTGD